MITITERVRRLKQSREVGGAQGLIDRLRLHAELLEHGQSYEEPVRLWLT